MTDNTDSNRRTDPVDDSDADSKPRVRSGSGSRPNSDAEPRPQADGGTATGADETALDPWGSSTIDDYEGLFERFGIKEFEAVLSEVSNPHYLMRRGVIFGHREYDRVARALRRGEPAAALSGFMPTGEPHVGHKLVFDELIWHQRQGADTYGLIADLEAHSARGLSWSEIDEHARDYLLSLLALGFDPEEGELYRQSSNRELQDLAFELGIEANLSEMGAIYGFDGGTDLSHMQSVVTQMADILYPQLDEPKPTVIPSAPTRTPTSGSPATWPPGPDISASLRRTRASRPTPGSGHSSPRRTEPSATSARTIRTPRTFGVPMLPTGSPRTRMRRPTAREKQRKTVASPKKAQPTPRRKPRASGRSRSWKQRARSRFAPGCASSIGTLPRRPSRRSSSE